ncbi:MAG: hypothetical protein NC819_01340 [Candidatus Omnitrophica bacterium]|nr:hypothetical protein [Candidatus Omnitrophota bacterium]
MRKAKMDVKPIAGCAAVFLCAVIGVAAAVWAGEGPGAPATQKAGPAGIDAEPVEQAQQRYPLEPTWREATDMASWWQWQGDVAFANRQYATAYPYYHLLARTFPDTPHGKVAVHRGNAALEHMKAPGRKGLPPNEDWLREIYDTLTW